MSGGDDELFDLLEPEADPPPHRSPALVHLLWSGAGESEVSQAFQERSLDSLIKDARGGDDEASRLLLKMFVLHHQRGAIPEPILDYVAGCLETFTCPPRRVPDADSMRLAAVEACFSLHRPTPDEVWKAFHLDRPSGRPEKPPFTREMSDIFLASCVATARNSGATIEQAWTTVCEERGTNLSRIRDAWRKFKHRYPPPAVE